MATTKVSKFVLEDNTVTFEKLALAEGAAGQVISVGENNQLLLTDRFTQEEIEDITAALLLRGNHTNLSISYISSSNQLDIVAHGAVRSVNGEIGDVVITTDNISEGTENLYFTQQRARNSITVAGDLLYNYATGTLSVETYKSADFDSDFSSKTTTDLNEGTNLYYTDARVDARIPTNVSAFTNDSGYLTTHQDLTAYALKTELFSGSYNDLSDVPVLVVSYNDLTDKPTIPSVAGLASETYVNTAISNLVNGADAAYDTLKEIQDAMATDTELASAINNLVIPEDVSDLTDSTNLFFSGSYNDLTDTPTIPTVPTNISAFANDSGYLTTHQDLSTYALKTELFSGSYNDLTDVPVLVVSYNDLTDTPTIPTVPTNVSEFTNDSGYLTDDTMLTDYGLISDSSVYGNGSNISSSITNVSSFNNDAGYISSTNTPVSTFNNDAGYLSSVSLNNLTNVNISNVSLVDNQFLRWNGVDAWINETINIPTKVSELTNDMGFVTSVGGNYMVTDADNTVSGSQFPSTDNTYDLGTSTHQWRTIYGHEVEATYADLAERYASDAPYEPGTVVVFGGEAEVTTTTLDTDVSIAGVVSTNPALKLNSSAGNNQTHPYIALKGRVPCKVIGPVRKGELLVTSSTPGYARSCGKLDMGLAVFAKALENDLSEGEKIIEVAVI